jgi:hypothetical protein
VTHFSCSSAVELTLPEQVFPLGRLPSEATMKDDGTFFDIDATELGSVHIEKYSDKRRNNGRKQGFFFSIVSRDYVFNLKTYLEEP